jgi:hypothetical protein
MITEEKIRQIIEENVKQVLNEQYKSILGFYISNELFNKIKKGEESDFVLKNYLYHSLNGDKCVHYVSDLIIKKIRGGY